MPETTNDLYQDILIARALEVSRLQAGMTTRALRILNQNERDLAAQLRTLLETLPSGGTRRIRRVEALLKVVRDLRAAGYLAMRKQVQSELGAYAVAEVSFTKDAFLRAAGLLELSLVTPVASAVRSAVLTKPFNGRTLTGWFKSLEQREASEIARQVNMGLVQGESIDQIVRRVRGTRAARFTDGVIQTSRRGAESIVRTAVTHATAQSRRLFALENPDMVRAEKWTAVLDGRTTLICASNDGRMIGENLPKGVKHVSPPGLLPPAHINCRSILVYVLDARGVVGNRPFVTDTRTRRQREINFRSMAKENAGAAKWKSMTERQRRRAASKVREKWAIERVGTVPAETNFEEFLRRGGPSFQDEWLGPTRGKLFREGNLTIDRFHDHTGRQYNLDQLRSREANAFREANLTTATQ